ncbi:hypothetical protein SDC9_48273 [bioreactor metagenome]|uniref:NodB homology domain-containing protein n=1 Tax=bioreactor metagenome TaxID=1076179 RepID=A0A644WEV6_9ZZZZ
MKKRLTGMICAVIFLFLLLVSSASAADEVLFLALNDSLKDLTADYMPIRVNNIIYVPCTTFDQLTTGVNLGVFFGQDKAKGTVTLYSRDKTLIFDIGVGYSYDSSGSTYLYRATTRDGRTYLPAFAVCQFFGLDYSALSTDYGTLIRIKNSSVVLSDRFFVSSASNLMSIRLNEYLQSQAENATPAPGSSNNPVTPSPTGDRSSVKVYLAFRVDSGENLDKILDALEVRNVPALFFFRLSDLPQYDDIIRRMVGSGHQIGFLVSGDSAEEMNDQLDKCNNLLEQIAKMRSYLVLVDGEDRFRTALEQDGWLCWKYNVDGRSNGRGTYTLTNAIVNGVDSKRTYACVLMDDTGSIPDALPVVLRRLREAQYDIRLAVETSF